MTRFLRFPDEARAIACLLGWYGAELGWFGPTPGALDVVGQIDGKGFHLNVVGEVPEKALPFEVFPAVPRRVFAGAG